MQKLIQNYVPLMQSFLLKNFEIIKLKVSHKKQEKAASKKKKED